MTERY